MAQVSANPVALSCDPNSVTAKGQNATSLFVIVQDSTNAWVWQDTPITFKGSPPAGCFTPRVDGDGKLHVKSRNRDTADTGTWSYSLFLKNTQTSATATIDPDIVNEL